MRFTAEEIAAAQRLKVLGLQWQPRPGHYVWDGEILIEQASPFHDRVYFILELKHFLRRAGSIERLTASMTWLPTWHDMREELTRHGVPADVVAARIQHTSALLTGRELLTLYDLLAERLGPAAPDLWKSPTTPTR